jgi:hypothetical protein
MRPIVEHLSAWDDPDARPSAGPIVQSSASVDQRALLPGDVALRPLLGERRALDVIHPNPNGDRPRAW